MVCILCKGKGVVITIDQRLVKCTMCNKRSNMVKIPCDACTGMGKESNGNICGFCNGKGYFKTDNKEIVNHPSHYGGDTTYEVIKVIEAWELDSDFCLGNTIKYIARAKYKSNQLEDLKKAQWYLNRKISNIELDIEAGKDD